MAGKKISFDFIFSIILAIEEIYHLTAGKWFYVENNGASVFCNTSSDVQ